MYFKELEIRNFRNYLLCKESFNPKINIIIGENGQGKTSLVEALYVMSLGRSFRTQKYKDMIMFGEDTAVAKSVAVKNERNIKTDIIFNRYDKKKIRINGLSKKTSDLSNNIIIVAFSPEDMKIVKEDPDKRRRFINREISQLKPAYYEALIRYTKILNQRNVLIKSGNINRIYMEVWNNELVKYGSILMRERYSFIQRLSKISSHIHSEITDEKEKLVIEYNSDVKFDEDCKNIADEFKKKLIDSYNKDIERGLTSHGPHRDDIKLSINGIDVRKFGSQGQQRTAALSLKLAEKDLIEAETGEKPILILDDVLSELDIGRQNYLINSLKEVQVFLTSTHISDEIIEKFKEKNIFEIKGGKIINKV